jgi:ABC-type nitrate/sulfonate/bicarbonate transport system substrate-binding protein
MKKLTKLSLLLLLIVAFFLIGCQNNPEQISKQKLTASYIPITAHFPLFVAIEEGFFEQNNLEIEAIEATSPNDIMTGIASGKIDFSAGLAYSILFPASIQYPNKFKLITSSEETQEQFTASIITLKNSEINSYHDLPGKKVGVYKGIVQKIFLKAMIAGMGIEHNQVEMIEISPRLQIQGLVSGEYEALSSTEPTTIIAKLQGKTKIVEENPRVKYIMDPFPSTAGTISNELIINKPKIAKAVVESLNLAIDFINEHPEEAKKHLLKYTPIPKDIAQDVLKNLKLFKYSKLGEEHRENVQKFADFLFKNELISEKINVNDLFIDL